MKKKAVPTADKKDTKDQKNKKKQAAPQTTPAS